MQCSLAFPLFAGRLPLAPTSLVATPSSGEGPLLIPATPPRGIGVRNQIHKVAAEGLDCGQKPPGCVILRMVP